MRNVWAPVAVPRFYVRVIRWMDCVFGVAALALVLSGAWLLDFSVALASRGSSIGRPV